MCVVNCFHVFDRWLGVPHSKANFLLNKQWGKRREEEWGVGENTGCHLYFIYASVGFFFLFLNLGYAEDWEFGDKLELWGFIYEESSRFPSLPPETEACHYSCLYWYHGELWFSGWSCKSFVRHCPSLPGSDVPFGEAFRIQAVQGFAFKVLCWSEMPEAITRLHLP